MESDGEYKADDRGECRGSYKSPASSPPMRLTSEISIYAQMSMLLCKAYIKQGHYIHGRKGKVKTNIKTEMVDQESQHERKLQTKLARYL